MMEVLILMNFFMYISGNFQKFPQNYRRNMAKFYKSVGNFQQSLIRFIFLIESSESLPKEVVMLYSGNDSRVFVQILKMFECYDLSVAKFRFDTAENELSECELLMVLVFSMNL